MDHGGLDAEVRTIRVVVGRGLIRAVEVHEVKDPYSAPRDVPLAQQSGGKERGWSIQ